MGDSVGGGSADAGQDILRTMYRYARALDYGLEDEWLDVFTPDARYDTILPDGSYFVHLTGHDELRAFLVGYPHPPDSYQKHISVSPIIEIDGDEAVADSGWVFLTRAPGGLAPRLAAFGRYRDRLRRLNGVWRFSERICDTEAVATE
jgi:SnoaL-like domain